MRKLVLTAMLASFAASAAADPLTDALEAGDGSLCFARHYDSTWLKAHPGQTLRDAMLSLTYDPEDNSWTVMRVKLQTKARTIYLYGGCGWDEHVNRGVQDNILDPSYKPESGVGCHMMTDVTGVSAEEGGDFPVDWRDPAKVQMHLPDGVAAWASTDVSHHARFVELKAADRIIRMDKVPASECQALVTGFAPGGFR